MNTGELHIVTTSDEVIVSIGGRSVPVRVVETAAPAGHVGPWCPLRGHGASCACLREAGITAELVAARARRHQAALDAANRAHEAAA